MPFCKREHQARTKKVEVVEEQQQQQQLEQEEQGRRTEAAACDWAHEIARLESHKRLAINPVVVRTARCLLEAALPNAYT